MSGANSYDLAAVRRALPVLEEVTYLNTGTVGIMAEPVLATHLAAVAQYERGGHAAEQAARAGYETARAALARLIGAEPDEIALTRNATDGVSLVAASLSLGPDDLVLTTDQEHPAVLLPWALAQRRGRGRLSLFAVSPDPEETFNRFAQAVRPATRLVVVSHVSCETGARLPVEAICSYCRERDILTLIDCAQSVGQFPVDVRRIGCDFATGNGHKWLCGPKGTGFLYVRADRLHLLEPPLIGEGAASPPFDRRLLGEDPASAPWSFVASARRFEYGTRNLHDYAALRVAIEYLGALGWEAIEQHMAATSGAVKEALAAEPGVTLYSPWRWEDSSGLVTFGVEGWTGEELSRRLWDDYGIIQRRVQVPDAVRVSCAYFTGPEDLERLLAALHGLRRR
jgi:selenocysteine lyase/cysteine desulfurase